MGGPWGGGAFELAWDIDVDTATGQYKYVYTISNPLDVVSPIGQLLTSLGHWLLEVSSSFFSADLLDGTIPDTGPEIFGIQALSAPGSNPGLPSDLYGFAYDDLSVTLITFRSPMDGSFYAKNSPCNPNSLCADYANVLAYNTGLVDPNGAFIRVPNTLTVAAIAPAQVPEPTVLILLGVGLIAVGVAVRRITRDH